MVFIGLELMFRETANLRDEIVSIKFKYIFSPKSKDFPIMYGE